MIDETKLRDTPGHARDEGAPDFADGGLIQRAKLYRPPVPSDLVPRPRLLGRLDEGRSKPLILISAPPGYGKSVLVSNWLESVEWPGVWFSLDAHDAHLRQFMAHLVAAVRTAFPRACHETLALIGASQLRLSSLVVTLSNDLDAIGQPFVLALDDYHRLPATSPVHELLGALLDHPPIPLHLVILTRRDPPLAVARLRAMEQVIDLRAQDLRFSKDEARSLFEETLGLTVGEKTLVGLDREQEGWAAGLRLASLAARRSEDPEAFPEAPERGHPADPGVPATGSHRAPAGRAARLVAEERRSRPHLRAAVRGGLRRRRRG